MFTVLLLLVTSWSLWQHRGVDSSSPHIQRSGQKAANQKHQFLIQSNVCFYLHTSHYRMETETESAWWLDRYWIRLRRSGGSRLSGPSVPAQQRQDGEQCHNVMLVLLAWLMRTRPVSRVLRGFNSLFSHRLEQRHSCGKNICLQGLGGLVNLNEKAYICPKLCYKEVIVVVSPLATVYSVKHCLQVWWWCRCCPHPISVSS